ncbi:MAG: PAS domain-containing protein [Halobacteriaceae archaeon]
MFENATDPVMEVEFHGRTPVITAVNAAFEEVFGVGSEVVGESVAGAIVPEDRRESHRELRDQVIRGNRVEAEVRRETADGVRDFLLRVIPFDVDDVSGGAYAWYIDITERKRREKRLRQSQRRFEAVFEDPDTFIGLLDPDGRVVRANRASLELIDADPEDVEGEPFPRTEWWERSPTAAGEVRKWIERAAGGESVRFESEHHCANGDWIHVDGIVRPVTDRGGEVVSLVVEGLETTERASHERTLEELHEATRRFMGAETPAEVADIAVETARRILDLPLTGLWLYDDARGVFDPVAWTDEAERLLGEPPIYTPENSLSGRAFREDEVLVYDDVSEQSELYNPDTENRSEIILPLGEYGVMNVGSTEVGAFDDADEFYARLLAATTEAALARAERESAYRDQRAELRRQNERLEEFASVVSHDLRGPLNVAEGRLELARRECDSDHLDTIADQLDRMEALIGDVLSLARRGETVDEPEPTALGPLVEEAWTVGTEGADGDPALRLAGDPGRVNCDRGRVHDLLANLFRNAVEHGGDGVTVEVGALDDGFYVADDGPDIPADEREDVFDAGYSTADGGTGFGLAIVEEIAEAHGWDVALAESESGGARFEFTGVERP